MHPMPRLALAAVQRRVLRPQQGRRLIRCMIRITIIVIISSRSSRSSSSSSSSSTIRYDRDF